MRVRSTKTLEEKAVGRWKPFHAAVSGLKYESQAVFEKMPSCAAEGMCLQTALLGREKRVEEAGITLKSVTFHGNDISFLSLSLTLPVLLKGK